MVSFSLITSNLPKMYCATICYLFYTTLMHCNFFIPTSVKVQFLNALYSNTFNVYNKITKSCVSVLNSIKTRGLFSF